MFVVMNIDHWGLVAMHSQTGVFVSVRVLHSFFQAVNQHCTLSLPSTRAHHNGIYSGNIAFDYHDWDLYNHSKQARL